MNELAPKDRCLFVRNRLIAINRAVSEHYIENGLLLQEFKNNKYFAELGFDSFDHAIEVMQERGELEYGPRNARNFVRVVEMIQSLGLDMDQVKQIPISKLREIASVPEADQRKLLQEVNDLTVGQLQEKVKAIRKKASGQDVDPLRPIQLMLTETMVEFYRLCLNDARRYYSIDDNVPDATVLVDVILADWRSGIPDIDNVIEAECSPNLDA